MKDGENTAPRSGRWWLDPALARAAFGSETSPHHAPPAGTITFAMQDALRRGRPLDLDDPQQRMFGEYELLELIGQGGMGCIYRARQRTLDREVAVKLLSAGQWANEELIETLRREAHQTAALRHPNIVVVHELGEQCGLIFYVMEFVPGRSLAHRIDDEGPLPPEQAATVLRAVAEAVDYAHRLGVLHLDLKPGNILVDDRGEPRIADFGLARRIEHALERDHVTGTPCYMAPEQARTDGPPLSPATDIWALGAVLYEAMTGRPPFSSNDPATTLRLVCEEPVRAPSRLAPVPADLEAICLRCLTKEPARRYPHARALADDLARFADGLPVSVRPLAAPQRMSSWARRQPRTAASVGLTYLVLLIGLLLVAAQWQRAAQDASTAQARLQAMARPAEASAEATDGAGVAAPADTPAEATLPPTGPTAAAPGEPTARPLALAVSPDGGTVAMLHADRTLRWYDAASLSERRRTPLPDAALAAFEAGEADLAFAPDGALRLGWSWSRELGGAGAVPPASDAIGASPGPPPTGHDALVFSDDRRHALLRDGDGRLRLWQPGPWRPLSEAIEMGGDGAPGASSEPREAPGSAR